MKKILSALVALALMLCGFAMAETIRPMDNAPDLDNGTYPASFDQKALADGILKGLHLYTIDRFSKDDIARLAVGDILVIEGKEVEVATLEKESDTCLLINGGYDNNGFTFQWYDPDPEFDVYHLFDSWMSVADNDYHTYTEYGVADYEMVDEVTFRDSWDIDAEPVTVTGLKAVTKAINEADGPSFFEYNTDVTLKDGKVVEIQRDFIP